MARASSSGMQVVTNVETELNEKRLLEDRVVAEVGVRGVRGGVGLDPAVKPELDIQSSAFSLKRSKPVLTVINFSCIE